jgi:hypothetical protein
MRQTILWNIIQRQEGISELEVDFPKIEHESVLSMCTGSSRWDDVWNHLGACDSNGTGKFSA